MQFLHPRLPQARTFRECLEFDTRKHLCGAMELVYTFGLVLVKLVRLMLSSVLRGCFLPLLPHPHHPHHHPHHPLPHHFVPPQHHHPLCSCFYLHSHDAADHCEIPARNIVSRYNIHRRTVYASRGSLAEQLPLLFAPCWLGGSSRNSLLCGRIGLPWRRRCQTDLRT
jgi:hypothetical protein